MLNVPTAQMSFDSSGGDSTQNIASRTEIGACDLVPVCAVHMADQSLRAAVARTHRPHVIARLGDHLVERSPFPTEACTCAQALPFQCSINGDVRPPVVYEPTAHTLPAETADTPYSLLVALGLVLPTMLQFEPFQCSISAPSLTPL